MAAVIRVKRRINEEPFEKFVLNCKRRRTSVDETRSNVVAPNLLKTNDETTTILKFTGTIKTEDDIKAHITRLTKSDAEQSARKTRKIINVTAKNREQLKLNAQNSRFKVINWFRSTHDGDDTTADDLTIVDVVKDDTKETSDDQSKTDSNTDATKSMETAMETDYVYDLYMVEDEKATHQIDYDNLISIRPFDDLVYQANDDMYADSDKDSEDSNDEDNWRNDYPDTDDNFSVGEDDMRRAVEDLNIGSDDNLSSDESDYGREPVVHFLDADDDLSAFDYFKKYGRVKSHGQYYRKERTGRTAVTRGTDSDTESSNDASVASYDE